MRHTALGPQWLILFAVYAFLKCKDSGYQKYPADYYVLSVFAVTIHPYFLPLVMIFALISVVNGILRTRRYLYFLGLQHLIGRNHDMATVFGKGDRRRAELVMELNDDMILHEYDGYYFLFPQKESAKNLENYFCADLTDDNWTDGISNYETDLRSADASLKNWHNAMSQISLQ